MRRSIALTSWSMSRQIGLCSPDGRRPSVALLAYRGSLRAGGKNVFVYMVEEVVALVIPSFGPPALLGGGRLP